MKFTLRRNGEHMATIQVRYHVDRELMVSCLALKCVHEMREDLPQNPSRKYIEDVVRETLWRDGSEKPYFWGDQIDGEEQDEILEWAEAAVNGAFPELVRVSC